ncbi:MAG TPA: hypothetical protein VHE14_08360, partial [Solirubrobacteraceae bacterium]|nr:hypothetical protein [Solirubrobacteraceae bacterium]
EPTTGMRGGATGRLVPVSGGPFATELRFDPLPSPALPPGFTITLKRATLRVGAERTVTASTTTPTRGGGQTRSRGRHRRRRSRQRRGKKRAHAAADVRHDLITNPPTCGGTWAAQVRLRYPDRTDTRDVAVPCVA